MSKEPFDPAEASAHEEDAGSQFKKKKEQLKAAASDKMEDIRSAASAKADEFRSIANDAAEQWRGKAEDAWGDAQVRARSFHEDGEAYVRENPTRAIVGAAAAGFLLAMFLRK